MISFLIFHFVLDSMQLHRDPFINLINYWFDSHLWSTNLLKYIFFLYFIPFLCMCNFLLKFFFRILHITKFPLINQLLPLLPLSSMRATHSLSFSFSLFIWCYTCFILYSFFFFFDIDAYFWIRVWLYCIDDDIDYKL